MTGGPGQAFAAAAASFAGTPFRLHGSDPATGLDCVGLVAAALERSGRPARAPRGYRLRAVSIGHLLVFADANGFAAIPAGDALRAGDLVLTRPSPVQAHLVVALGAKGFVHAHAGLGRVVCEDRAIGWPATLRWRLDPREG